MGSTRRREIDSSPKTAREHTYHRRTLARSASLTLLHSSFSPNTAWLKRVSRRRTCSAHIFTRSRSLESMRLAMRTTCNEAAFSSIHSKSWAFCASPSMWYSSRMRSTRSPWPPTALSRSSTIVCVTSTSDEPSKPTIFALCALSNRARRSSMKKDFPAPGGDTTMTTQGSGRSSISLRSLRKSPSMLLLGNCSRNSPGMFARKNSRSCRGSRHMSGVGQHLYSA
mmetsp:Transcript_25916/g.56569  ORF Transcript_25916/g.56569 Transcript_25916/m.56569 type:complete len:225 (+) Transcript_25916:1643-2317(+)